jgi:hypothetical protein
MFKTKAEGERERERTKERERDNIMCLNTLKKKGKKKKGTYVSKAIKQSVLL